VELAFSNVGFVLKTKIVDVFLQSFIAYLLSNMSFQVVILIYINALIEGLVDTQKPLTFPCFKLYLLYIRVLAVLSS
jgi:hypothetical protein